MIFPISWKICLVVISFNIIAARAFSANITSNPTSNISSMLSESMNIAASQKCTDIKTCRTLKEIIISCLVTILACVWFAVHRNIPAPKQNPSRQLGIFVRAVKRAWSVILAQMEVAMVFVVALLAPEWVLAWALRQAIVAWKLAGELEEVRSWAESEQKMQCSQIVNSEKGEEYVFGSEDVHSSIAGSVGTHTDDEDCRLLQRRSSPSTVYATCAQCKGNGNQCHRAAAAYQVGKGNAGWKWSHGFLVAMGGFHFYNEDGPLYPLSPANVLELVARGHLVPPTAEELSDRSKGDALSKGVAIIQTLWFVVQCIARRAEHLPVTNLEVMTLAYTVITVAMYAAWWAKPLNVSCAVRVPQEQVHEEGVYACDSIWERFVDYVAGAQDEYADLQTSKRVPTFWAGKPDQHTFLVADLIALLVAMVFGAVHSIAWYSEFQSHIEQKLWRWSTIVIIAVPLALITVYFVASVISECLNSNRFSIIGVLYIPIAVAYISARLILITLSFHR